MTAPQRDPGQLTAHFHRNEFAVSASFPGLVVPVPSGFIHKCEQLALLLERYRPATGPIRILSGYRTRALNLAVDGSQTSQHMAAEAVDVRPLDGSALGLFKEILTSNLPEFSPGQIIWYPKQNFVHIALASRRYPVRTFCVHDPRRFEYQRIPAGVAGVSWLLDHGYSTSG